MTLSLLGERSIPPVRITVDQYHRMIETGILREGEPIELLDGQLVRKDRSADGDDSMSIGKKHVASVEKLGLLNPRLMKGGSYIRLQSPVTLAFDQEPEPDGAIVRGTPGSYLKHHPGVGDIFCVIEVADSSLIDDRGRKQRIYAAAGIPQYLIVNLVDGVVEEYTDPLMTGRYARVTPRRGNERIELRTSGKSLSVTAKSLLP